MISVVTPTFNERENIEPLYREIKNIFLKLNLEYEHIIIDNCSNDGTDDIIRRLAKTDKNLKIIINQKNYGGIKSPYYGLVQANGEAAILMNSDFQDPPELITDLIKEWKKGYKIVLTQKNKVEEKFFFRILRSIFYKFLKKISSTELTINTTGSGLFDREIINLLKKFPDPNPYLRGLVLSFGFNYKLIPFTQPKRKFGKSKISFLDLIEEGFLGITKHSILPLRLITILGFISSSIFFLIGIIYFILKLMYWDAFQLGFAPILLGVFFIGSIIIFMLGIIGEYLKILLEYNKKVPLIIEKERINF